MSIKLPKIIRRDALILRAVDLDHGMYLAYEDIRPNMPGGRGNA